VYIDTTF